MTPETSRRDGTEDPCNASTAEARVRLLLIEDDEYFRDGLVQSLDAAGFDVQAFGNARAALRALPQAAFELVLTDLRLPDLDGLGVLERCRAHDAELPVVMMTGHADVTTAVKAIKEGAYDFIEKPFGRDRLVTLLRRAVQQYRLAAENRVLRSRLANGSALADVLCGDSRVMRDLRVLLARLAPMPVDVLICGETGTGKELAARALHDHSGRSGDFVAINCAALPEALFESELFGHEAGAYTGATRQRVGRIEHASGGTLFLDEIEAMAPTLQAKLLRALQESEVQRLGANKTIALDLRVVAATNAELEPLIAAGQFRADLYYRLNAVTLRMPPLRDRRDDIPLLFHHFLERASLRFQRPFDGPPPELRDRLLAYGWPGNVRELKSAAERHLLGLDALASSSASVGETSRSLDAALLALEGLLIEDSLRRCKGQAAAVCHELNLAPATLYRKIKSHGLTLEEHRNE
jgi:two-component system C4-dicarboxylate transport response regulator DctD